ncbi:hypothetical protein MNEG_13383 [Monoraphidium neglectum]|uniref:Uncharacterized protein n=1 Tax=Monoraphidium neglectum TaxID=145388 RepID=A0A0D2KFC4_9CHLO|nr:hypothetical protein MNEG_13383 [Monoraphidium neglectum]KIY94578.1 hypothetical protein MNEG_13383 [Monoraphidium neglectum]|eukprot:XP_013893598.1 hypothetical protein MNEG_13383 [Monoraphidium neglectum]
MAFSVRFSGPVGQCAARSGSIASRSTPARPCPVARAQSGDSPNVDDMLAEANALLNAVTGGDAAPKQYYTAGVQESIDELTGLGFVCDESGCVLVLPAESTDDDGADGLNTLLEGQGWRLGVLETPDDAGFPALVSGPSWSVPLGASELGDLLFVLQQLRLAVSSLADQGQWLAASAERPISRAKANIEYS